jgi:hypothetical protein
MPLLSNLGSNYSTKKRGSRPVNITNAGQQAFTTPGTYTWVAPAGVTSISVVSVGGGAAAAIFGSGTGGSPRTVGGAGGALAYKNNISVVPGTSYTVVVGAGGQSDQANGSDSWIAVGGTIYAGARGGGTATPGTYNDATNTALGGVPFGTYDGGGNGGVAGVGNSNTGGGGAGGYTGNGNSETGGAGGSGYGNGANASGGGGVGILGQSASGANSTDVTVGGGGGSGGANGFGAAGGISGGGGKYGGGGGQNDEGSKTTAVLGGDGAVRIIWPGTARRFPSTNTGNM